MNHQRTLADAPLPRQQWVAHFIGDTPDHRLDGRLALREQGAVRFAYETQYSLTHDAMIMRVNGYSW